METKRLLSLNLLAALLVASLQAVATPVCDQNGQDVVQEQRCKNQSPEEEGLQKEFAEFEANYPSFLAKKNAQRRIEDLKSLKSLTSDEFCVAYGEVLRGGKPRFLVAEGYADGDLLAILKKQAKSRRLNFDDALLKNQKIRHGMTKCMLYASFGQPVLENKTTGRWGVHIQHVFGKYDEFVYTENGRVTGWQN